MACYYPFMAIYYQNRGLNYSQIGILFAINSLIVVIAQPLWGIISDKYLSKKKSLALVLGFSSVIIMGFVFAKSFLIILITVILFTIFQSPTLSINDALCYEVVESYSTIQYGKMRIMGSVGYAVIALALAPAIKISSIDASFFSFTLFAVLGILVLRGINVNKRSVMSVLDLKDIVSIIKNKKFILLGVSALIVSSSMSSNSNYLAILIQKTGGDVSNIGLLWFIVAMSELPAFFMGNRIIKKFGNVNVYLLSLGFYTSRFLLDSLCSHYQAVLFIQILQSLTYPLYVISTLQCINEIVPSKARTTAITVFSALSAGFGGFIGNISGGFIIQNFSVFYLYRIMAGLCIIALIIGLTLKNKKLPAEINMDIKS